MYNKRQLLKDLSSLPSFSMLLVVLERRFNIIIPPALLSIQLIRYSTYAEMPHKNGLFEWPFVAT